MSSGLSSALEISARVIREHTGDIEQAHRAIKERRNSVLQQIEQQPRNLYLRNLECGYAAAISAIKEVESVKANQEAGNPLPFPPKPRTRVD